MDTKIGGRTNVFAKSQQRNKIIGIGVQAKGWKLFDSEDDAPVFEEA